MIQFLSSFITLCIALNYIILPGCSEAHHFTSFSNQFVLLYSLYKFLYPHGDKTYISILFANALFIVIIFTFILLPYKIYMESYFTFANMSKAFLVHHMIFLFVTIDYIMTTDLVYESSYTQVIFLPICYFIFAMVSGYHSHYFFLKQTYILFAVPMLLYCYLLIHNLLNKKQIGQGTTSHNYT
jgi:hypothetical protein